MINVHFIVYYFVLADLETGTPGRIGALLQVLTGDNPLKKNKIKSFQTKEGDLFESIWGPRTLPSSICSPILAL